MQLVERGLFEEQEKRAGIMANADCSFLPTVKSVSLAWWDATSSDDEHYKVWLH